MCIRDREYPLSLQDAFKKVINAYVEMAENILIKDPTPHEINYENSSYSVWRSSDDLRLNWNDNALKLKQKVLSLGYPYSGATTSYDGELIYIREVEITPDINIVQRPEHVGKIWKLRKGHPYIICGAGMLKITKAYDKSGTPFVFNRLRKRLK